MPNVRQLHIERRYLRFVFGNSKLPLTPNHKPKQMQKGRHGLCIYIPVVCRGYIMPFRTLYGCIYNTMRGAILKVLLTRVSYNLNSRTDGSKSTRFFYVSLTRLNKTVRFGLLGGKVLIFRNGWRQKI